MTTSYEKGKLYQIPLTDLIPDPDQPRKVIDPEALERLMKEQNLTQEQLGGIVGKARSTVRDILTINRLPRAIRDECRGDRIITRQTLIEIARKKQERSMISTYKTFRLKQEKAGKANENPGQPEKKNPNHPDMVLEFVQKIIKKIDGIDTTEWSADDREKIFAAFTGIKDQIDTFLNPNPEPS